MTTPTPPASAAPSRTSVIFAGEIFSGADAEHPIIHTNDGGAWFVRVRAMPARHLGRILQLCLDEAALLGFVCQVVPVSTSPDLPPWEPATEEWVDSLHDEAHVALYEAAKRQNFTRAAAWGERQIAAKNFQAPLLLRADETMAPVVAKMVGLIVSSLNASGSPAAPSTKS